MVNMNYAYNILDDERWSIPTHNMHISFYAYCHICVHCINFKNHNFSIFNKTLTISSFSLLSMYVLILILCVFIIIYF